MSKSKKILKVVLFGISILIISACNNEGDTSVEGVQTPKAQLLFVNDFANLQENYLTAKKQNNEYKINDAIKAFKPFLSSSRYATSWIGEVEGVDTTLGITCLFVEHQGMKYRICPPSESLFSGNRALEIFKVLNQGDMVFFSGKMTASFHFSDVGDIEDPSMDIEPTTVTQF